MAAQDTDNQISQESEDTNNISGIMIEQDIFVFIKTTIRRIQTKAFTQIPETSDKKKKKKTTSFSLKLALIRKRYAIVI